MVVIHKPKFSNQIIWVTLLLSGDRLCIIISAPYDVEDGSIRTSN